MKTASMLWQCPVVRLLLVSWSVRLCARLVQSSGTDIVPSIPAGVMAKRGKVTDQRAGVVLVTVSKTPDLAQRIESLRPRAVARVAHEPSIDRALERIESEPCDVLIVTGASARAGGVGGIELLDVVRARSPQTQVLLLVRKQGVRSALAAVKAGAYQYAKLPVSDEELRLLIETAARHVAAPGPPRKREFPPPIGVENHLVGRSAPMQALYKQLRQTAVTDVPVLLEGKTGTGKDLAARQIHANSDRQEGSYVPVNLASLPIELVASELFGHEKGAFTGATRRRQGKFELARDGTIFLDEIGMVDEKVQVSLLRLIEQRRFHRLGGKRAISTNARIIAASNQDLIDLVRQGRFRDDLYYRLDVFRIKLPPLRERAGDIPLLVDEFLCCYNEAFGKKVLGISPVCMGLLESYEWPGNVRELKNVVQRAVLVCPGDVILLEHLPPRFQTGVPVPQSVTFEVGTPLDEVEREMVRRALAATGNNRTQAAELLGISRRALYNKLRKHGID